MPDKARTKVSLGDFERPRLDNTLYTAPDKPPDTIGTDPEDGLPRPFASTSMEDAEAPAMSPESFVCMADTRMFVVRDRWGKVVGRLRADEVERAPDGSYRVPLVRALEVGVPIVVLLQRRRGLWCEVEPIRPQCKHYVRQLRPWPGMDGVRQCIRYCSALQDEHGELVSINDESLYACELRSPQAWDTIENIEEFDRKVVESGGQSDEVEFNVDQELAKSAGGIFSTEGG